MLRGIFGFVFLAFGCWSVSYAQEYSINVHRAFEGTAKVSSAKFVSGEQLVLSKRGTGIYGFDFKLISRGKTQALVSDDIGAILRAIPSPDNAIVVIYANGSSGTCCAGILAITVAVAVGDKVEIVELGSISASNAAAKLDIRIKDKKVERIVATHIDDGENELGDKLYSDRRFVSSVGFVDVRFRDQFLKLLGKDWVSLFFQDEELRRSLLTSIGADKFRKLRTFFGVRLLAQLKDGRYLVAKGCMSGICGVTQGSLVIDGVSGGVWAAWGDSYEREYGLGSSVAATYDVGNSIGYYLSLDVMSVNYENGKFVGIPRKR